jgi:signal transduction histidine kinase
MSMIAVQAETAPYRVAGLPDTARAELATIATSARSALADMRRLLGVLRQGDEPSASLTPAPGLSQVADLVEQFREAGLTVDLRLDGEFDGVPDGVDLSAYRIVQEGLTNVLRHGGLEATVTIAHWADAVRIEISDDGRRPDQQPEMADAGRGAGHGLIGMRERVSIFGGSLVAEERPGGGFRLAAMLPFGVTAAAGAVPPPLLSSAP